jgi:hypothetical protein
VSTTPKPLLTVIYGLLHTVTNDWRPIAWATILAFGLAISGVGALVSRVAGPVAGAFSAVAVVSAPALLSDVGYSLATPWALLGWVAAGLAVCANRPRYGLAGFALLLATLARIETLVVVGLALTIMAAGATARRPLPRRAWLVPLIAMGALPLMCLHDWLLSGDPLFWTTVAVRYSQATDLAILSPREVLLFLAGRYGAVGALTILAAIGVARLIVDRRYALVIGLLGLGLRLRSSSFCWPFAGSLYPSDTPPRSTSPSTPRQASGWARFRSIGLSVQASGFAMLLGCPEAVKG